MRQGARNIYFAKTLIHHLIEQGVSKFCLSPGLRSTPLVIALKEEERAETIVHFDERGAAFYALGCAKASKKPAAVVVTSGTAVGNLMGAVMEASEGHIPLILLTCDRPPYLRDTMANQTTDQVKIFGHFVRHFVDLPTPSPSVPQNFLATTIARSVVQAQYPLKGPVQINCPFEEPLFDEDPLPWSPSPSVQVDIPYRQLPREKYARGDKWISKWTDNINPQKKGVIVLGAKGSCSAVSSLAEKLDWPILADITSGHRSLADTYSIPYAHHVVKNLPALQCDLVLQMGDNLVSKELLSWMGKQDNWIHVSSHPKRCDPLHKVLHRVVMNPDDFCQTLISHLGSLTQAEPNGEWLSIWQRAGTLAKANIEQNKWKQEKLTEPLLFHALKEKLSPDQAIFIGNSMPIRDADMFFYPERQCGPIFANRGLSGIDGNIATIAGIASHFPVFAVIGDQTALYDLNSLALLNKTKYPVQLTIINNGGGGIFSFRSVASRKDLLDTHFAAAHTNRFSHAAALFSLSYDAPHTCQQWIDANATIVEVVTDRQENRDLHDQIDRNIQEALCSSSCTVS